MKAPSFWYNRPGFYASLLTPLGNFVAGQAQKRAKKQGYKAHIPVICVGNLIVGGSGKTPTTIAIVEMLRDSMKKNPHILMRGYGGSERGPLRVEPARHDARQVGDEALLLSEFAPVWIGGNRGQTARYAYEDGADCLVMDDGFQNFTLEKDFSLLVIDAVRGFGNGHVMPAGPLRERVLDGLKRADATLMIGSGPAELDMTLSRTHQFRGDILPLEMGMEWQGLRCFAFAGIAHPKKFFDTLKGLGAELVGACSLSDHHPISAALFKRLSAQAEALGAQLVTTEKDAVRLPKAARGRVLILPVRLRFSNAVGLKQRLERLFNQNH